MRTEKITVIANDSKISPYPLGVYHMGELTRFSLEAPIDAKCELLLYRKRTNTPVKIFTFPESNFLGNIHMITISGLTMEEWAYHYRVDGINLPDPCGKNFIGASNWGDVSRLNEPYRTLLTDYSFDWEDDVNPNLSWNELVIYRLHVRGFTTHKSSGIKNKGTFAGIIEKLPYLKELGITAIELMPAYEFEEIELAGSSCQFPTGRINYWGYNRSYYYAPKASFSGKEFAPDAFRKLVKALHKSGIEVFMEFYFTPETSTQQALDILRYWKLTYHLDGFHILGNVNRQTIANDPIFAHTRLFSDQWEGCSEEPLQNFRQYLHSISTGKIIESTTQITNEKAPLVSAKSTIKPTDSHLAFSHQQFQDDIRHFLRGDEGMLETMTWRISENPQNIHTIHYVASNNGFTLKDLVTYEGKHNEINGEQNRDGINENYSFNCGEEGPSSKRLVNLMRKTQIFNALTLLFLSQAPPLLQSGDEMGHTQYGNNNAWCQDNTISWIDWKDTRKNKDILEFVKFLLALRKNHTVFRNPKIFTQSDPKGYGMPDISFHGLEPWRPNFEPFCRQLAVLYEGRYAATNTNKQDSSFYLLSNMYWIPTEFWLPVATKDHEWRMVFTTARKAKNFAPSIEHPLPLKNQKRFLVEPRSIVLLVSVPINSKKEDLDLDEE